MSLEQKICQGMSILIPIDNKNVEKLALLKNPNCVIASGT